MRAGAESRQCSGSWGNSSFIRGPQFIFTTCCHTLKPIFADYTKGVEGFSYNYYEDPPFHIC